MACWQVPDSVRERFSSSVSGLGMETIEAGERELARLVQLKKEMLGQLIQDVRGQIVSLWDEMEAGSAYRADFAPFSVTEDGYCDGLLEVHEAELARLQARVDVMRPILKLITKRQEIVKERKEVRRIIQGFRHTHPPTRVDVSDSIIDPWNNDCLDGGASEGLQPFN